MPQPRETTQPQFQFYSWCHKMSANEWAAIAVAVGTLIGFLVTGVRFLVKSYLSELKPNGGSSVKDQVGRLEEKVEFLTDLVLQVLKK